MHLRSSKVYVSTLWETAFVSLFLGLIWEYTFQGISCFSVKARNIDYKILNIKYFSFILCFFINFLCYKTGIHYNILKHTKQIILNLKTYIKLNCGSQMTRPSNCSKHKKHRNMHLIARILWPDRIIVHKTASFTVWSSVKSPKI